jgi:hypothetical protein
VDVVVLPGSILRNAEQRDSGPVDEYLAAIVQQLLTTPMKRLVAGTSQLLLFVGLERDMEVFRRVVGRLAVGSPDELYARIWCELTPSDGCDEWMLAKRLLTAVVALGKKQGFYPETVDVRLTAPS